MIELRLLSMYYSPEFTRYFIQHRIDGGPWVTGGEASFRELPQVERDEVWRYLREPHRQGS